MAPNPRVLIADDDPSMRALLEAALHREGFETELVTNGRDALARLRDQPFDVVLLDVDMPFLDGMRTLREIRSSDRFGTLPVILVTGSVDEAERIRGLERGADDYIGKPVQMRELAARVRAQLRERSAWTTEMERGRQVRRNLTAALEGLSSDGTLLVLASELVSRLPRALDVDGAALLHFAGGTATCIAAEGAIEDIYPAARPLPDQAGREVADRAATGPWIQAAAERPGADVPDLDIAYVPFRLGPTGGPIGCLVFALRPGAKAGPLSHRLAELVDATEVIVVVLRPAVERAETTDAAISRLREVIAERQFNILLQPIVRLEGREVVAVEALTRFVDGTPPELRFEEAATLGLGGSLERAAARLAIDAAQAYDASVALSINLSADTIQHEPSLPELFGGVDRPLIVELTEHERVDDYDAVRSALARLGPNVRLAIDDAGSGFASLRHIFALQPAYVKLDLEWVRRIDQDPVRRALVSGLVYFANETSCELIAEGIETEAELTALLGLGVRLGQGFFLGRPA